MKKKISKKFGKGIWLFSAVFVLLIFVISVFLLGVYNEGYIKGYKDGEDSVECVIYPYQPKKYYPSSNISVDISINLT